MAKKKKKSKKGKNVELNPQKTITILVPDVIGDLDKKILHGIGRMTCAVASPLGVTDVAIVKTSLVAEAAGPWPWPWPFPPPPGWQKSGAESPMGILVNKAMADEEIVAAVPTWPQSTING
jgi:hypothetical protein